MHVIQPTVNMKLYSFHHLHFSLMQSCYYDAWFLGKPVCRRLSQSSFGGRGATESGERINGAISTFMYVQEKNRQMAVKH